VKGQKPPEGWSSRSPQLGEQKANTKRVLPGLTARPVLAGLANSILDSSPTKRAAQLPALDTKPAITRPNQPEACGQPAQSSPKDKVTGVQTLSKVLPKKEAPNLDLYLKNFDSFDLDKLLQDWSRPGCAISFDL